MFNICVFGVLEMVSCVTANIKKKIGGMMNNTDYIQYPPLNILCVDFELPSRLPVGY